MCRIATDLTIDKPSHLHNNIKNETNFYFAELGTILITAKKSRLKCGATIDWFKWPIRAIDQLERSAWFNRLTNIPRMYSIFNQRVAYRILIHLKRYCWHSNLHLVEIVKIPRTPLWGFPRSDLDGFTHRGPRILYTYCHDLFDVDILLIIHLPATFAFSSEFSRVILQFHSWTDE